MHSVKGIKKLNNNLVVLLPEAEILRQIKQKISGRKDFKNLDNKFIIEEDQVVIEGFVPDQKIKSEIGYLVSETVGVRVVINNLTVSENFENEAKRIKEFLSKQTIYFPINRFTIPENQIEKLNEMVDFIKKQDKIKLNVKGFSDISSSFEYNLKISRLRAQNIADYIISQNFPSDDIVVEYFGDSDPVASNDTKNGQAKNRRVEFGFKWREKNSEATNRNL
ncbi:OmpA family protein [candidate division KSB1 bacterium]|nr:OmpA family protein [candidate division KSB1 bacterium]